MIHNKIPETCHGGRSNNMQPAGGRLPNAHAQPDKFREVKAEETQGNYPGTIALPFQYQLH